MSYTSYAVLLYDEDGIYSDALAYYESYQEARNGAESCIVEGGKAVIERRVALEEVTWARKFKTRKL